MVSAENGAVALGLCDEQDFDLILLDLIMPEIGGYEVLAAPESRRTRTNTFRSS